jgi:predicted pyridoxine 5'-phosphate oxidase superfamily flavin-nucleotide-binding protein
MDFYTGDQRVLQDQFETRRLADTLEAAMVRDELSEDYAEFISTRDFFFLSTVNGEGEPTVSYKGGPVGMVQILDPKTLTFPIYDGNGMFLSLGNVNASAKIGMLFMDFESPHRVRVQATATVTTDQLDLERFPGAIATVKATVDEAFVNCGRYVHKHVREEPSKHVPDVNGEQPFALWKRIDVLQDAMPPKDKGRAVAEGGLVTIDEYSAAVDSGES